jgi:signal transduction histidine kinase
MSDSLPSSGIEPSAAAPESSLPRTTGRLWRALLVAVSVAVLGMAVWLLWRAHVQATLSVDQLLAYATFVLVAGAAPVVLTMLVRRLDSPLPPAGKPRRSRWQSPVSASLMLSTGMALLAGATYWSAREFVAGSVRHRLETVAMFEASVVTAWVEDARNDIRVWSASPHFIRALQDWRNDGPGDTAARKRLLDFLMLLSQTSHYAEVGVRDPTSGVLLLTTRNDLDSPVERDEALLAANSPTPLNEVLRRGSAGDPDEAIFLGYFTSVQVPGSGERFVVDVDIDLGHELFPIVEPALAETEPRSAEVLLMQREGNAMATLNDAGPRHAARLQAGLDTASGTPIGGLLAGGAMGFLRGSDDRGRLMLAYARPVAQTAWVLVAEVDEAEAFAELNKFTLLIAAFVGILLLLAGWWWVENRRHLAIETRYQLERSRQGQRLTALSRRVVSAQEDERRRLASELHDRTGANLATINLNLKSIAHHVGMPGSVTGPLMEETSDLLADTIVSIREFCGDLRPPILDHAGLQRAIENCLDRFKRRTGIAAEVDHTAFNGRCAPEVESVLFRIVQEAVLNCAKHASARMLKVRLEGDQGQLILTIEDDGTGFDPQARGEPGYDAGSGLLSMRERAEFLGGSFALESAPGRGTRIRVQI